MIDAPHQNIIKLVCVHYTYDKYECKPII